jgi:hypothetical protein
MFALSDADLRLRILGCAEGPASFNTEATRRGTEVISIDPLYQLGIAKIRDRIATTYDRMLRQPRRNSQEFVWHTIGSVEELGRIRMQAMQAFLKRLRFGKAVVRQIVVPYIKKDFILFGGSSSVWDRRLIRRPAKKLAENVDCALAGLRERGFWSSENSSGSTLPPHNDGAARRVSEKIESCFQQSSELL